MQEKLENIFVYFFFIIIKASIRNVLFCCQLEGQNNASALIIKIKSMEIQVGHRDFFTIKFFTVLHGPTYPMAFVYIPYTQYTLYTVVQLTTPLRTSQPVNFIG